MNHFYFVECNPLPISQEVMKEDAHASDLLFDKHVDYVVNHGNDKNDFVSFAVRQLT